MKTILLFGFALFLLCGCVSIAGESTSESMEYIENPDAPVTIIEFSDFQCPYCAKFYSETLPKIKEEYVKTGKVRIVYKHFPLAFHENAFKAAEAAECAREQGKFWEMHNKLFENSNALAENKLREYANSIGLNMEQFNSCLDSGKYYEKVIDDLREGQKLGVKGTPTFFINGDKIVGAYPYEYFKQVIDRKLQEASNE